MRKAVIVLLLLLVAALAAWGLVDWLNTDTVNLGVGASQRTIDQGTSYWLATIVFVAALLALVVAAGLVYLAGRGTRAYRIHLVGSAAFVATTVMTINSLGFWLWPAAAASLAATLLMRIERGRREQA